MKMTFTSTFQSLSVRNFRLFVVGQLVSVAGTWMLFIAQDWLVLSLTGDSATALGVVTALQFTPILLLTLYGGRLADRHDKRWLLVAANTAAGVLALVLAVIVLSGSVQLWHVYLFALCLGSVNAVEVPARMAFVSEMVGPDLLPNASALSAAYFNVARIVGPGIAGLLISRLDTGPVILLNAISYVATVGALLLMRPAELRRSPLPPRDTRITDGIRYTAGQPDLMLPFVLVAFVGMFGFNFQLILPLMSKTVFGADAASFGLLATALGLGSLLGAFAATVRRGRPTIRVVVGSAIAFGVLETVTGLAPTFAAAVVLLVPTGFATIYFAQAANHRIQLGTDPAYRGRVMALYTLVFQGSTPVGTLIVSWLAGQFGPRSGLYVGGLVSLAAGLAALLWRGTEKSTEKSVHHPTGSPIISPGNSPSSFPPGPVGDPDDRHDRDDRDDRQHAPLP